MGVHRIDALAEPQPRVGDLDRRRGEQLGDRLGEERSLTRRASLIEPERRRSALEPGVRERVVVVARDEHHGALAQLLAEPPENRLRPAQHGAGLTLA